MLVLRPQRSGPEPSQLCPVVAVLACGTVKYSTVQHSTAAQRRSAVLLTHTTAECSERGGVVAAAVLAVRGQALAEEPDGADDWLQSTWPIPSLMQHACCLQCRWKGEGAQGGGGGTGGMASLAPHPHIPPSHARPQKGWRSVDSSRGEPATISHHPSVISLQPPACRCVQYSPRWGAAMTLSRPLVSTCTVWHGSRAGGGGAGGACCASATATKPLIAPVGLACEDEDGHG